jgi:hypothetical protein
MRTRIVAGFACAVLLQGCPVYQVSHLPDSKLLSHALPIAAIGDFNHLPSRYEFPSSVAEFNRVALVRYDTGGLDISAGYNGGSSSCPVVLTIYVSPAPRMSFIGADPSLVRSLETEWLQSKYVHWKNEITGAHPQAALESEVGTEQDGIHGKKAVYKIGDSESELSVSLVEGTWFLTYRISYPTTCAPDAKMLIQRFSQEWRGRG